MGKIIGSVLVTLLLVFSLDARLRLAVQTMDGEPISYIGAGQPFILQAILEDATTQLSTPEIKGLDQFVVKNSGFQMRTVNGVSMVKYQYIVRSDTAGTFTIGPAIMNIGMEQLVSDQITLTIGNSSTICQESKSAGKKQHETAFIRLITDKTDAVIGEKITGIIRFYAADNTVQLHEIHPPSFENIGFEIQNIQGPEQGIQEINGITYTYAQWSWEAYPTKSGELVLPAYWAEYSIESKKYGFFSQFFDRTLKRIYSNAVTIHVDPLAPFDKKVHGIGKFSSFTARIEPTVAKQGEGMVLTLELQGEGNFAKIETPELQGIPSALRIYESKQILVEPNDEKEPCKKRFEYIVQPLQAGDFEIPAQQFTYFDVKEHRYQTRTTRPLFVTVVPAQPEAPVLPEKSETKESPSMRGEPQQESLPLVTYGPWQEVPEKSISWFWFFFFAVLPICLWFIRFVLYPLFRNYIHRYWVPSKIRVFRWARRQIIKAYKYKNIPAVYKVFTELFAWHCKTSPVSESQIRQTIERMSLSQEQKQAWELFFNRLQQSTFYDETIRDYALFFEQAKYWLKILREQL